MKDKKEKDKRKDDKGQNTLSIKCIINRGFTL